MGTSEAARARYRSEGAAEFRQMIRDLRERGWSDAGISRAAGLYPTVVNDIMATLRIDGDEAFLVEPRTYHSIQKLHSRVLARDRPDVQQEIESNRIKRAHAKLRQERRARIHAS
jgi:hypothetical protein